LIVTTEYRKKEEGKDREEDKIKMKEAREK
jgi:hypothetical protein